MGQHSPADALASDHKRSVHGLQLGAVRDITSARIVHGDLIDAHDQIYEIPHSRKAAANVRRRAARHVRML